MSPRRDQDEFAVEAFLRHVNVLDLPEEAAIDYAQIRAELRRRGEMIGANDLFIAAHARCNGLILVTNNIREFGRVERLKIENWTQAD
ncbi:MAG: PIN domain-containing protein [Stellaceae bacterium]